MNGPVYRHDDEATDNSRRWPAYWDGRWFLHNNGGASAKHGVLLDPATDQDGGLPVWADSLRTSLSWAGSYMDSKFGDDGALYVQVYDGFFRAGSNAGIYRYDYTGGPDTPFANPAATALGANQVRFSSAGSGGVSYRWDFGDGSAPSTEANPTHTYPAPGNYTARLTVTYADGGTSVKEIPVLVLEAPDETAPVTTAALDPALPGPGGTYNRPVTVTLTATDQGGTGVARTEYRIDGGPFRPYSQPVRVASNGSHTDRLPLDRRGRQRRGDEVGAVHDRARRRLPGRSQRRVLGRHAQPEVGGPAPDRRRAEPDRGTAESDGPRRRHDRRHRQRAERPAPAGSAGG